MSNFLNKLKAAADATGKDQTQVKSGDFERVIYPEGPVKLRFVSYVELGKHDKEFKGVKKTPNLVRLGFEVSGPKHPPVVGADGIPRPLVVYLEETLSQDPKANWVKLFSLLNYDRTVNHAIYKLGEAYLGRLVHRKFKRKDDPAETEKWTGLDYRLREATGNYTLRPPIREDVDTGEVTEVQVGPALTPLAGFLWDAPDQDQWDSIFIEGEFPERKNDAGVVTAQARTKNVVQERILRAANFKGSPIYAVLVKAGAKFDITQAEDTAAQADEAAEEAPATKPKAPAKQAAKVESGSTGAVADDIDAEIPW
jgi:hypothetical protein